MYLKIRKIAKEAAFILVLVLVLLFLVNILLYFIPKSKTPIDITLNGDKVGAKDIPLSSILSFIAEPETLEFDVKDIEPITIKGYYIEYFFREPQLDISISSIDGFANFKPGKMNSGIGIVFDNDNSLRTTYIAERDGRPFTVNISFTEDFNNWLFAVHGWDAFDGECDTIGYYGASTTKDASAEYYEEVFAPLDFSKAFSIYDVLTVPVL